MKNVLNVVGIAGIKALQQAIPDFLEIAPAAEDDGAATEAAPGEARAEGAGGHGGIDEAIERGTTDGEAITQAGVPGEQDAAESFGGILTEGGDGFAHAGGFGDDVQEGGRQVLRSGEREEIFVAARRNGLRVGGETDLAQ